MCDLPLVFQELRDVVEGRPRLLERRARRLVHLPELAQMHHRAHLEDGVAREVRRWKVGAFLGVHGAVSTAWVVAEVQRLGRIAVETNDAGTDDRALAVVASNIA